MWVIHHFESGLHGPSGYLNLPMISLLHYGVGCGLVAGFLLALSFDVFPLQVILQPTGRSHPLRFITTCDKNLLPYIISHR
jgi:hypothetical protein